jgi:hypothetical protein
MEMDQKCFEKMMLPPTGEIDAVLDTDAYNEIDDQFAISYLLKHAPRIRTRAIFAAPFLNERSTSPEDGMERSYLEILRLLKLCNREDLLPNVYRGSTTYLQDEASPVESPAAERLVELSREYTSEKPLYVVAIGAITNVASALLLDSSMAERIVVVWLGGHGRMWPDTKEFNLWQDVAAARVVFDSDVPLVQLPCMGVVSAFTTTAPELRYHLSGKNPLADYLAQNVLDCYPGNNSPWSRVIWDVTAVAWLTDARRYLMWEIVPRRRPTYEGHYETAEGAPMVYVYHVHRDALMRDLFGKLLEE